MNLRGRTGQFLALLAAVALAAVAFFALRAILTDDTPEPPSTQTVMVDGSDADRRRDDPLVLGPSGQDVRGDAADGDFADLEGNMRRPDSTHIGLDPGVPLAAQEWPGCKTAFVGSFSSRRGVTPKAIAYHYTAGSNRIGWSDLDGLTAYSNNPRNQVSWHFGVDREGHCTYNVPVNQKAWTIAGLNSQTINFEIVGTGKEVDWAGTAGIARVAAISARIVLLYPGIQIRLGATDGNCNVTRTGIITHWMGGPCSGGHRDIRPYSIERVIAAVRAAIAASLPTRLPGPSPKPAWFWTWCDWYRASQIGHRPDDALLPIPLWGWQACDQWAEQH